MSPGDASPADADAADAGADDAGAAGAASLAGSDRAPARPAPSSRTRTAWEQWQPTERDRALDRLAGSVRSLVEGVVTTGADVEEIDAATYDVEQVLARLRKTAWAPVDRDRPAFLTTNAVIGTANPYALPLQMHEDADMVRGTVVTGAQHEGPPQLVHGGVLAHILDHALGHAVSAAGRPGFTRTLTMEYLRPTPLGIDLTVEAWMVDGEARITRGAGHILVDGEPTVRAEGVFILPRRPIYAPDADA